MPDSSQAQTIGDLPVQTPSAPATAAEQRARFFNSGNAFMIRLTSVPDAMFVDEPARALDPATPTGLIPCDLSSTLQCDFVASTPLVLAYYARIRAGETLAADFVASGICHYVIQGTGTTECAGETIRWRPGDVFLTPGGETQRHSADADDAVLWIVDDEPLLAHQRARAPAPGDAPTPLVHYPAAEIDRQIDLIYQVGKDADTAGAALIFSSEQQQASRNVLPTLTLAMNTLEPGASQRAHRHNSVAVSLVVRGQGCYSMIDGRRKDWTQWATTITPPVSVHSHHNEGAERAMFLIVQDGGLYYHARANGFEFVDD